MTKKKTAKKKVIKTPAQITIKQDVKTEKNKVIVMPGTCSICKYFRINGEGAKRGRCHRYPSSTPTEINHFCGEYE